MRKVLYFLLLVATFLAPVERVEVGKLLPVKAVAVYKNKQGTVLETDSGAIGIGEDVVEALTDLQQSVPAVLYLKTTRYLFVSNDMKASADSIVQQLNNKVLVYICNAEGRVYDTAKYLDAHGEITNLHGTWTK